MTNNEAIETLRANYPDACYEQLREAVDAAIEALKAPPKWIPVTERLPKKWRLVLGFIQFDGDNEQPAQLVLWYLGNGRWREIWRGEMIESAVTRWMPLPEPPKRERKDNATD